MVYSVVLQCVCATFQDVESLWYVSCAQVYTQFDCQDPDISSTPGDKPSRRSDGLSRGGEFVIMFLKKGPQICL
jgi:hypothetical protein